MSKRITNRLGSLNLSCWNGEEEREGCSIERATESDYIHGVESIWSIPD
jgi:hypothetical protein